MKLVVGEKLERRRRWVTTDGCGEGALVRSWRGGLLKLVGAAHAPAAGTELGCCCPAPALLVKTYLIES